MHWIGAWRFDDISDPLHMAEWAVRDVDAAWSAYTEAIEELAASGACASYQLAANSAVVAAIPPERRGQAFGLANGGMQVFQGLWIVLAGGLASVTRSPGLVIAMSGGIGAVLAAALAVTHHREPAQPAGAPKPSGSPAK